MQWHRSKWATNAHILKFLFILLKKYSAAQEMHMNLSCYLKGGKLSTLGSGEACCLGWNNRQQARNAWVALTFSFQHHRKWSSLAKSLLLEGRNWLGPGGSHQWIKWLSQHQVKAVIEDNCMQDSTEECSSLRISNSYLVAPRCRFLRPRLFIAGYISVHQTQRHT